MLVQTEPGEGARLAHDLVNTISLVGHVLEQQMDHALSETGLTARQYQALFHIAKTPGLSRGALGRLLCVSPQGAGAVTRRLRDAALVDYDDAGPGLPVSFTVTEAGQRRLIEASPIVAATGRRILAPLPTGTIECLAGAMNLLATPVS
jgi:DNA-binding MarR family transcriptional regulator